MSRLKHPDDWTATALEDTIMAGFEWFMQDGDTSIYSRPAAQKNGLVWVVELKTDVKTQVFTVEVNAQEVDRNEP